MQNLTQIFSSNTAICGFTKAPLLKTFVNSLEKSCEKYDLQLQSKEVSLKFCPKVKEIEQ